jgi:peptide/nickel transport system ATP-binding protein
MLELDKVTKDFSTGAFGSDVFPAVRRVSFEILAGQVTALIGESGSGKTTLGKMILRLESISSGSIVFDGRDISLLKGRKELIEYYRYVQGVFQDPFSSYNPIFRADRVFQMVKETYFPDVRAAEWHKKVGDAVEAVGLNPADVLNKFTHQLSGGQLQRLLIARALLLDIKLLIADEIISMLDASTRIDVLNLLADLKSRGLGILFITHDLSLGNYISERAVILRRGIVLEMGATEKVFSNPQHPYTKMLLASVPQLHHKWEPLTDLDVANFAPAVSVQDGPLSPAVVEGEAEKRRAGSSLNPLAGRPGRRYVAASAGSLLQDVERRREKDLRRSEEVLPLVEVEEDHYAAVTEPVARSTHGALRDTT